MESVRTDGSAAAAQTEGTSPGLVLVEQLLESTNRPPKGDRSEGFYIKNPILIMFGLF